MFAFLKELFASARKLRDAEARILEFESALQSAKLDLEEKDEQIDRLQQELKRSSQKQESTIRGVVSNQMEQLFQEASAPVAQLATQAHLINAEGRALMGKDVVPVAMRLVRCLETAGLRLEGVIGSEENFNSERHDLTSLNDEVNEGSPVVVRMPAVIFGEQVLRKMAVLPASAKQIGAAPVSSGETSGETS